MKPVVAERDDPGAEEHLLVRGLYTAASGAIVAQSNVDIIANNLANVNTSGFKRTLMQIQSAPKTALYRDQTEPGKVPGNRTAGVATRTPIGDLGFGSTIYDTPAVFEQGPIETTGNSMDVALNGPGFLAVRDANGQTRYTRGGSLVQNGRNQLVTGAGEPVLGANGQPITLPPQGAVNIDRAGNVSANGVAAGKLAVYEFANLTNLRPEGANKFINTGAAPVASPQTTVLQGAQEKSNAQVVPSMVGLIANERWFDANQKMMQTQDDELAQAINTVGKTAAN